MLKYLWPKNRPFLLVFSLLCGGGLGYGLHRFSAKPVQNTIYQTTFSTNNVSVETNPQKQASPPIAELQQKAQEPQIQEVEAAIQNSAQAVQEQIDKKSQEKTSQALQSAQYQTQTITKLSDIKQWNFNDKILQGQLVIIVADLPFNQSFEQKIIKQLNQISKNNKSVRILRKDIVQEQNKRIIEDTYKGNIKPETLFLLKNNYQDSLNNIDFDMYVQYPRLLQIYLKAVPLFRQDNITDLTTAIAHSDAHSSCLLYLYDNDESEAKQKERLMTAKYIQMQLLINNLSAVSLYAVERKAAVAGGLIDQSHSRTNSIHLFRKQNIYTPSDPNYYLKPSGSQPSVPFHRLEDVALFAKGSRNLLIPSYLSNIETFDSAHLGAPFVCTLKVDRNRIIPEDYSKLLQIFGQLKKTNVFPNVSFALRLKQIPYTGSGNPKNKQWQITLSNIDELDKQTMIHQIKTQEQLKSSGFDEKSYLRSTHEYLYQHTQLTTPLVAEFIQKATKGQVDQYFKSEQKTVLAPIKKLAAKQFHQAVLNNHSDHLVFQFSDFCPTCKQISPIIGGFADIIQKKGLGLSGLQFHRIDANKNRVQQYLSSPYIPNIYYFKDDWKSRGPVRFPIEFFSHQGILQLYNFCSITKQIKTIDWVHVQKSIESAKTFRADQLVV